MTTSKILLVNDDGIHALGLRYLYQALQDIADVTVVAPDAEQSGAGTSISMRRPLHITPIECEVPAFSVNGTPADCVKMALAEVLKTPPDLVLSGINRGSNAGRNIFYSGTVGGAVEAAFHGLPAAALSCAHYAKPNYEEAASTVPDLVRYLLSHPLPPGTILNVNFPHNPIQGFRLATQGKSYWKEEPDRRVHPDGFHYYWLAGKNTEFEEEDHSDIALLEQGFVTAVPVRVAELTHHELLASHHQIFSSHFKEVR